MFCTHLEAELSIPEIIDDGSESWWSYVKLPLFLPYFQLVCGPSDPDSDRCFQTIFFTNFEQVLVTLDDASIEVSSVQLVSPGYMNSTGHWQIDLLEAVYRGVEVQSEDFRQYAYIYVVSGGTRYLQSCIAAGECDLSDIELVRNLVAPIRREDD